MSDAISSPFGRLPTDWTYESVINQVEFLTGPAFDSSKFNTEGLGAKLVRGINLTKGATRWHKDKTKYWNHDLAGLQKFTLSERDILIGMDGSLVGKNYAYLKSSDLPALLVQRVARLRTQKQLNSKFLYYMFGTDEWLTYVEIVRTNSGIPHISNGDIKTFTIPFPPLPEQQKIAAILTSVDEVIEKTQAQIDKLKDLKTGMMQELLTKGIGHSEFKDSSVGSIPVDWEVVPISELCSDVVDCVNKTAPVVDYKTPYKMIRTTNVRHGRVDTENVRYVDQETYETWTRRMRPENGDLIFTREAPVGECGVLEDSRGVFLGQRTMMYRANEQLTSSRFLMYSLMSNYGKQQLDDFSGGSTVAHMRVPDCNKILIKTPPIEEQNKIVNAINSIDVSIQKKESKLEKTINTKKALMQDLLTGKVRVNTDQANTGVTVG